MGRRALQDRNHSRSYFLLRRSVEAHAVYLEELASRRFIGELVERNIFALPTVLVKRVAEAAVVGSVAHLRGKDRELTCYANDRDGTAVAGDVVDGGIVAAAVVATNTAGVARDHFGAVAHNDNAKVVVVLDFSAVFNPAVDAVRNAHRVAAGSKWTVTKTCAKAFDQRIGTSKKREEGRKESEGVKK